MAAPLYVLRVEVLPIQKRHTLLTAQQKNAVGSQSLSVPSDISITELVNGVKIFNYDTNTDKIYTGADIKFSLKAKDTEYLELAKNPEQNEARLREMVEEAAKEAGYNSPKLYHGTSAFGFTEFDISKSDDKRTIFLTSNEKIASTYSGVSGERKISDVYNKDIESLSVDDVAKELNKFVKEHYG